MHSQGYKKLSGSYFRDDREMGRETHSNIENSGMPNYSVPAKYLEKLDFEYHLAGEADGTMEKLNSKFITSFAKGDFIHAANLKLLQGDIIHSAPFTSPIALNLISTVRELGWNNDIWDSRELDFSLVENKQGYVCWEAASSCFQIAACSRGMGAVQLRYACVKLARALDMIKTASIQNIVQ